MQRYFISQYASITASLYTALPTVFLKKTGYEQEMNGGLGRYWDKGPRLVDKIHILRNRLQLLTNTIDILADNGKSVLQ